MSICKKTEENTDLNLTRSKHSDPKVNETPTNIKVSPQTIAQGLLKKCPPGTLPAGVNREMLYAGKPGAAIPPYPKGSRLRLHFKATSLIDGEVIDDSRTHPKPMEFLIGKKFKLEIWELAMNTMFVGEVSKFIVAKEYCVVYPMVSKLLRNAYKPSADSHQHTQSCCANLLSGTGHKDLDQLLAQPQSLIFTFELLEVSLPGQFEMEAWYMTDEQKLSSLSDLQEEGNKLYWDRHYKDASAKYMEALSRIEQLMNKEAPGTPEMKEFQKRKVPLLLNYAICKQHNRDYYEAIKYNNLALEIDPESVKGVFRRGQCYKETAHWNEARADFRQALKLDPTLRKKVKEELEACDLSEETEKVVERNRCRRMFEQVAIADEDSKKPEKETDLDKQKRLVGGLLKKIKEQEDEENNKLCSSPAKSDEQSHPQTPGQEQSESKQSNKSEPNQLYP